jgi:polysaccharide export outer membrane protein
VGDRAESLPLYGTTTAFPTGGSGGGFEISPGDELEIRFVNHPEFDRSILIRPDGRLSIPFAEEVLAAGLTVAELDKELTKRLAKDLKDPDLTVVLKSSRSQVVFVGGEVKNPGMREIESGSLTLGQAVMMAGGYIRDTANLDEVVLVRRGADGFRHACKVDLGTLLVDGRAVEDVFLCPQDIVIVPPRDIVDVNDWIDRYINRNIPGRGFFGVNLTSVN